MDTALHMAEWAGRVVAVEVDRPLGSRHPRHTDIVYPVNYGYVPGTLAADGEPVDAYLLGLDEPVDRGTGRVVAIIHRDDDIEDKLVVAAAGEWDEAAIVAMTWFQERWFRSHVEMAPAASITLPLR